MTVDPETYAKQLLHLSARIVGAVHFEHPDATQHAVDRALIVEAPTGVDPVVALVTVLAAQVDPETTATERLAWVQKRLETVRKAIKQPRRRVQPCGTPAAYKRHHRAGESPCDACLEARRAVDAARAARAA